MWSGRFAGSLCRKRRIATRLRRPKPPGRRVLGGPGASTSLPFSLGSGRLEACDDDDHMGPSGALHFAVVSNYRASGVMCRQVQVPESHCWPSAGKVESGACLVGPLLNLTGPALPADVCALTRFGFRRLSRRRRPSFMSERYDQTNGEAFAGVGAMHRSVHLALDHEADQP